MDGVLFRPAPYADPDRIVAYGITAPIETREFLFGFDYLYWRGKIPAFEAVTSMFPGDQDCDLTETNPARLTCACVESTFLPFFGVQPVIGRNFTRDEDRPQAPSRRSALVQSLAHALRRPAERARPFPSLSTTSPVSIVGVLPQDFEMPTLRPFDILLPQQFDEAAQIFPNNGTTLRTFARLRPGWTPPQAAAALDPLLQRDIAGAPMAYRKEIHIGVRTIRDWQSGDRRPASWVLLLAVLAVLVARVHERCEPSARARHQPPARTRHATSSRRQPLATRPARHHRKPSPRSLRRSAGLRALVVSSQDPAHHSPRQHPRTHRSPLLHAHLRHSPRCSSLMSGLIFGALPALRQPTLEIFTGWRATSPTKTSIRDALVTFQIAGSLIMLTAAGLMLRTLWKLESVPLGIDTEHVVTAQFTLGSSYDSARLLAFSETLEQRLRNQPGVNSIAFADSIPPGGLMRSIPFFAIRVAGHPPFRARRRRHGAVARRFFRLFPDSPCAPAPRPRFRRLRHEHAAALPR